MESHTAYSLEWALESPTPFHSFNMLPVQSEFLYSIIKRVIDDFSFPLDPPPLKKTKRVINYKSNIASARAIAIFRKENALRAILLTIMYSTLYPENMPARTRSLRETGRA